MSSTLPIVPKPSEQPGVGRAAKEEPQDIPQATRSAGRVLANKGSRIEARRKARGEI